MYILSLDIIRETFATYVVRVPDPEVGSVPAWAVTRYWEELKYPPDVKYCRQYAHLDHVHQSAL